MLKLDQPGERKLADLPSKKLQTQSAPERGRTSMTIIIVMMMSIMMMIVMMTMTTMIIMYFPHPKGPHTGLVPEGPIKYKDDGDINEDDDNDNDDDDDYDNDNDDDDFFFTFFL